MNQNYFCNEFCPHPKQHSIDNVLRYLVPLTESKNNLRRVGGIFRITFRNIPVSICLKFIGENNACRPASPEDFPKNYKINIVVSIRGDFWMGYFRDLNSRCRNFSL